MSARYAVEFARPAERAFQRLDPAIRDRIIPRLRALAETPRPAGAIKLAGHEHTYRIRVGDRHIVYEIRDAVLIVLVLRIGHRREVYR